MWGTDAESVTPGNIYRVYKANNAFLYLLNRLSSNEGIGGWSKDEAMERFHPAGIPRTGYPWPDASAGPY